MRPRARGRPVGTAPIMAAVVAAVACCLAGPAAGGEWHQPTGTTTGGAGSDAVILPGEWLRRYNQGALLLALGNGDVPPGPPVGNVGPGIENQALPSVGNGYVASQVGSEVEYVSGLFNGPPCPTAPICPTTPHRAMLPSTINVRPLGLGQTARALDLATASVETLYHSGGSGGTGVAASLRVYAHRTRKHLTVVELQLTNSGPGPAVVQLNDTFAWFNESAAWPDIRLVPTEPPPSVPAALAAHGSVLQPDTTVADNLRQVAVCRDLVPRHIDLPAGGNQSLAFLSARVAGNGTATSADLVEQACGYLAAARAVGTTALFSEHAQEWQRLWSSGVYVEGNPGLARVVNATLYAVLTSLRPDEAWSTGPGGLPTNGYAAHVFWDMDTWVFPTLNLFHRSIGDAHLRFRARGLGAARDKARRLGYEGALYPWEATPGGVPTTNGWAEVLEHHVAADVALAFWLRWKASHDVGALRSAWPVLREVANFWASRCTCSAGSGRCHIPKAIGPDEWHCKDDNAYTIGVARASLEAAADAAQLLNETAAPSWAATAAGLTVPVVNATPGKGPLVHLPYANWSGEAEMQSGVADLGYPALYPMDAAVRHGDLSFFWSKVSGFIASMVWPPFVIGFNEVNDTANAALFMAWSYSTVQPPFNVLSEEPGGAGCPNFVTGAGGVLQAVWAGYGGVRVYEHNLTLVYPKPPPGSSALRLAGLAYRAHLLDVRIDASSGVSLSARPQEPSGNGSAASPGLGVYCDGDRAPRPLPGGVEVHCGPAPQSRIVVAAATA